MLSVMIRENCVFDPSVDFQAVDQFGFVDLVQAHETGSMPANVAGVEAEYNGVDDPASLMSHAGDVFEATRNAKKVVSAKAAASAEADAGTSGGAD